MEYCIGYEIWKRNGEEIDKELTKTVDAKSESAAIKLLSKDLQKGEELFINFIKPVNNEEDSGTLREAAVTDKKARYKLYHDVFDKYMSKDYDAPWIDTVFNLVSNAVSVERLTSASEVPNVVDGQKIKYRFSVEDVDVHYDPYREYVYFVVNPTIKEDLEDEFNILMKASDFKCKLSRYDIEESSDNESLTRYMRKTYGKLVKKYGLSSFNYWKFTDDGIRVYLRDGSRDDISDEELLQLDEELSNNPYHNLEKLVYEFLREHKVGDEIYSPTPGMLAIEVHRGDWKHDHIRLDQLMRKFFDGNPQYELIKSNTEVTEQDGSDTYSGTHYYAVKINEDNSDLPDHI